VIFRILAQDSTDSELRLKRYGELKLCCLNSNYGSLWGLKLEFWKACNGIFLGF
jgi:hypothetical protein